MLTSQWSRDSQHRDHVSAQPIGVGLMATDPQDRKFAARETRRKLAALYSDTAEAYRDLWAPELLPLSRRLLPHLNLGSAKDVLDAAAGVGTLLPEVRSYASGARIVAADLTSGMLRLASPEYPRVVVDASALSFKDGSFDAGILAFVLFHLFDPKQGVAEMARVLRPGGHLGSITWGKEGDPVAYRVWNEELDRHGAPPADADLGTFELVDSCAKVESLMSAHGVRPVRSWIGEYRARWTPIELITQRTRHGRSRHRFEAMPVEARDAFLISVRGALEALGPDDFDEISEVVYVTGQKT